ncbi:hypothetical protein AGMMS49940_24430 [Spirochaetia bacterium]|nr:hypothetical protein AGMMS49940_24430 [Spirochaetia bacterium]
MTVPEVLKSSTRNMSFRDTKEVIQGFQCIDPADNTAVIDCRIYMGKSAYSQRVTAAVWIHDRIGQRYAHGVGLADGGGYHKGSQAIESALHDMGIRLDKAIGGVGYTACKEAFTAIMSALGYPAFIPAEFSA